MNRVDATIILGTCLKNDEGMSTSQLEQEIRFLALRQQAVQDMLSGLITPDELIQIVEFTEVDPDDYVDSVCHNIELLDAGGVALSDDYVPCEGNRPELIYK